MKIVSLRSGGVLYDRNFSEAELTSDAVSFRITNATPFWEHYRDYWISLAGSTLERFDESRDTHGAAKGAIVGGLLFGGLGAIAGAAMGGDKLHSIALRQDDVVLVVEATTLELQALVGNGIRLGEQVPGRARCVATLDRAWTGTWLVCVGVVCVLSVVGMLAK